MVLHRILAVAVLAGALAGFAITGLQLAWTVPLIQAAEVFEHDAAQPPAKAGMTHEHPATAGHSHAAPAQEAWEPADGIERTFWTLVANVLVGVGGGLILAALFSLRSRVDLLTGLAFGAAAFVAFGLAPSLGLPSELPGTAAAALGPRQAWWAGTATATIAGLTTAFYGRQPWLKAGGLLLLAVPHLIGAPSPDVHQALAPASLQREFIVASLVNSAVFWIVLGGLTGWLTRRLPDFKFEPAGGAA